MNTAITDSMSLPKTLVIGAAGFLGRSIVEGLTSSGAPVVGLASRKPDGIIFDRFHTGRSELIGTLLAALDGCECVIFAGGTTRPGSSMTNISAELDVEAGHIIDIAELCAARGVKKFVFISSGGAIYGRTDEHFIAESHPTRPISNYGLVKLVAEHGLRIVSERTGLVTLSLRVANPFGFGQVVKGGQGFIAALINAVRNEKPVQLWGDGSVVRDFLHVNDVVSAAIAAVKVDCQSEILNVGSGVGHSMLEVIGCFERVLGREVKCELLPGRNVDVSRVVLDISKAAKLLGWSPSLSLESGMRLTVEREGLL